jgi:hydrogenase nickel incorporation protein HypA/HybF
VHELSIALSMIDEIEEQRDKHGGALVEVVHMRLGVLSGVDAQALRFAYEMACEGTSLASSRLEIAIVSLLVFCPQCKATHTPEVQNILCPRCLTPEQEILEGRELEVRALELAV